MRGILDYDNFGGDRITFSRFVINALLSDMPTTAIFGPAGVGKTTLATGKNGNFITSRGNNFKKATRFTVVSGSGKATTLLTRVLLREADKIILLEAEGGEEQILKQRKSRKNRRFSKHTDYSDFFRQIKIQRPDAKTCKVRYTGE